MLKYGRRPPKNAPALRLATFLSGVVPAHPAAQDNLTPIGGGWKMLGNDVAGDCVSVTWATVRRLVSIALAGHEDYPTQDMVWTVYRTQNPDFDPNGTADTNGPGSSADQGMDIQTLLEWLVKVGGPDGVKAVAFAKVDHTNEAEVQAAISIFGYVWIGLNVLDINQTEFGQGKPWDYVATSPLDGGHSVVGGAYGPWKIETWEQLVELTERFWQHQVEECWIVIWPEHLGTAAFQVGIDSQELAAAYQAITGKVLVLPTPTPAPVPTPAPTPGAASFLVSAAVAAHIAHAAARASMTPAAWVERHFDRYFGEDGRGV